jgi:alpha-L-fucosidase
MNTATPSPRQIHWHAHPFYGFVHFGINTFTDREWGFGDEDPARFNPTDLDCRQWARTAKEVGMQRLILTAKHHDGFCLWPSRWTEHSVKNSPWKDGKGDVVREFVEACEAEGIEAGLYLSPWDRNHAAYGTPAYIDYYHRQMDELFGGEYGKLYEIWLDGANGGDGWYGGANETRQIDRRTYYDFPRIFDKIRTLQPDAVVFSDAGPDLRWVGNESGTSEATCWSTMDPSKIVIGDSDVTYLATGEAGASQWIPPEVDVSIRPGWFWHPHEAPHSLERLISIWFTSVGHGHGLNLNIPPNRQGRFAEEDVLQLRALRDAIAANFLTDLAQGAQTEDTEQDPLTRLVTLPPKTQVNCIYLEEQIARGQTIAAFEVDVLLDGAWQTVVRGGTIGARMVTSFKRTFADAVRVRVTRTIGPVTLSRLSLYNAPNVPL